MLPCDPRKLTATDLKVQQAACWILGMFSAFATRGCPRQIRGVPFDRVEFDTHVDIALELVRDGCTSRGPIVLYALIEYVERMAPRFHPPLWEQAGAPTP